MPLAGGPFESVMLKWKVAKRTKICEDMYQGHITSSMKTMKIMLPENRQQHGLKTEMTNET